MPTVENWTVAASGGDYSKVLDAEAALPASLVADDKQINLNVTGSWTYPAENAELVFSGHTTDATRYVKLEAFGAARATQDNTSSTKWALRIISSGYVSALRGNDNYFRAIGLHISTQETSDWGIARGFRDDATTTQAVFLKDCFFECETYHAYDGGDSSLMAVMTDIGGAAKNSIIINCVGWMRNRSSGRPEYCRGFWIGAGCSIYNSTCYATACGTGGISSAFTAGSGGTVKNCVGLNASGGATANDFNLAAGGSGGR